MVKLKGPSVSAAASGAVADALVFSKTKKTAYMKKHSKPKNPRSNLQISTRAMITFLAQNWKHLSALQQATWEPAADATDVAAYHAFVAANSKRWKNFRRPSKEDPATETPPAPAGPSYTAVARIKSVYHRVWPPTGATPWAVTLHRSQTTPLVPALDNMIAVILQDVAANVYFLETPVETGTYYYRIQGFNETGLHGPWSAQRTVVVT